MVGENKILADGFIGPPLTTDETEKFGRANLT